MKVTYNWLNDFVEVKISAQVLADKLTMAGLEVTSLEKKDGDFVLEIEVTSNRPDCLSVIGIAREAAAITGKRLSSKPVSRLAGLTGTPAHRHTGTLAHRLTLHIEDKQDCPLYTAKLIRDVKIGPSPDWLKQRLELVGCRSVNNIVDITNYILFTYGEPLHAFDLDKLVSGLAGEPVNRLEIIVRRAQKGEEIVTIDGIKRILGEDILVIASGNSHTGTPAHRHTGTPIAIAGIMGGEDTEVTAGTKNVLLEAAIFRPVLIRRGRQKLGIQSESSYRFERGIDAQIVGVAARQAAGLMQKLAGGACVDNKQAGRVQSKSQAVRLGATSVHKILGADITPSSIKKILESLGFRVRSQAKNSFRVEIPSYRQDVRSEIDLIEEIARIYGYDAIPKTLPAVKPSLTLGERRDWISLIKNILVGLGLSEAITYSLVDKETLRDAALSATAAAIEIANPLSKDQEILRSMILPSLLNCVALNLNQKQNYIYIFEIASVFTQDGEAVNEELVLGIAACGIKSLLCQQGSVKEELGLLHLKGVLEVLFERLGIKEYKFQYSDNLDRAEVCVGQKKAGFLMQWPKTILDKFEIKNKKVCGLEISLDKLFSCVCRQRRFASLFIYPAVTRDLSLLIKNNIKVEDILGTIKEKAGPLLTELKIIDYYQGKQIPPGFKGLTVSCLYRSAERTLTEAEVDALQAMASEALAKEFGVQLRA